MNRRYLTWVSLGLSTWTSVFASEPSPIVVYHGYITQLHCKGTLYTSSVGNEDLVTLESIPKTYGCGVLLSPEKESGFTDVLLKTTTGDIHRILEIRKVSRPVSPSQLEIWLNPDTKQGESS